MKQSLIDKRPYEEDGEMSLPFHVGMKQLRWSTQLSWER